MARFLFTTGSGSPAEELQRRREVRRFFYKADQNGDGKLTKKEWHAVLNASGMPTTMNEVDQFFTKMDRDLDGRLSYDEFMGIETPVEKLFKAMDKNGDGFVTKAEFMTICKNLSKAQVEEAFAKFDSSGDNKLDYREFCQMINKRKEEAGRV